MQMEHSKVKNRLKSTILTSLITVIVVEGGVLAGYLFHSSNQLEYKQFALGILIRFLFLMTVVCFKLNKKKQYKSEVKGLQISRMVDDNGTPYLELKGGMHTALSAWLFSFILAIIIVWRLGVDDNITRKLLCLSFFGTLSIFCFLIGWCISRMRLVITFGSDKFVVFKTIGIGDGKQMNFSYNKGYKFYVKQMQGREGINDIYIRGNDGISTPIKCKLSQELANSVCAYANEQIDKRSDA
jgi:hypothetical protein